MKVALLLAAALLAGPAAARNHAPAKTGEQAVADAIGNRRPGATVDCIDPQQVSSTRIIDGTAILYDTGGRLYVQRPRGGAGSLRRDDVLVQRIQGGQLCRLDTVTLVEPATRGPRGFVVLGPFAAYEPRR